MRNLLSRLRRWAAERPFDPPADAMVVATVRSGRVDRRPARPGTVWDAR
jgi:hypothetical protein